MKFPYTSKKVPCEALPLAGDMCAKESLIPSCTLFLYYRKYCFMKFPYTSKKVPCEATPLAGDICAKESLIPSCTLFLLLRNDLNKIY